MCIHHIFPGWSATGGFLPRLGATVAGLRDFIQDALFVKKIPNFRVLCPNKMIGVGQRKQEPTDEEAAKTAALWGPDPVHPSSAAYRVIAGSLETDIKNTDARYTNPTKQCLVLKKPQYNLSQDRAGWVSGCSAALARRDSDPQRPPRGSTVRGRGFTTLSRGQRPAFRGRSSGGPFRGGHRGGGQQKFTGPRKGRSF
jgi:hypothetical protein